MAKFVYYVTTESESYGSECTTGWLIPVFL